MKRIISIILILLFITVSFARDRPPKGVYFPATDILIGGRFCKIVDQQIELQFGEDQLLFTYPVDVTVRYTVKSTEDEKLKIMLPYVDFFDSEINPRIYVEDNLVDYKIVPIFLGRNFRDGHCSGVEMDENHSIFTYMLYKYYNPSNPVATTVISEEMNHFYSVYHKNGLDSFYTDYLEYMDQRSSKIDPYSLRPLQYNAYIGKFAVFDVLLPADTEIDVVVSYQAKCSFYDIFYWKDNTVYYFSYLFQRTVDVVKGPVIDLHTPGNTPYLVSSNIPFGLVDEQHYQSKVNYVNKGLEIAVFHEDYLPDSFLGILSSVLGSPIFYAFIAIIIGIVAFFRKKWD